MTTRFRSISSLWLAALVAVAGCEFKRSSLTAPTSSVPSSNASALVGVWTSDSGDGTSASPNAVDIRPNAVPALSGCGEMRWEATTQNGNTTTGRFNVTCSGPIALTGTATGVMLSATTVQMSVFGAGTIPNFGACAFNMSGTGTLSGEFMQIPYTGSTCLGPVSGNERLRRTQVIPQ